jgi:hypothetical protein
MLVGRARNALREAGLDGRDLVGGAAVALVVTGTALLRGSGWACLVAGGALLVIYLLAELRG